MSRSDQDPFDEAKRARTCGDHKRALDIYGKLAEDGDPYALVNMAFMYTRGEGVAVDLDKAEELCGRAAASGIPEAHLQMASVWSRRGDWSRYFLAVQQAAEIGSLVGLYYLAQCHVHGRGVIKNDAKALELMRNAANSGYVRAKMWLARRLLFRVYNPFGVILGLFTLVSAVIEGLVISIVNSDDERVR